MRLSPHFTLEELTASEYAVRNGINNEPPWPIVENLRILAAHLEGVRAALGNRPIIITSGYRSPELNEAIGGSPRSKHMQGFAADFICPSYGAPFEICQRIIDDGLAYDQLIHEYGQWVHYGISDQPYRRQVFTICKGGQYIPGLKRCE